jgi:uncharacterized repeat protein (TIGR04076 family)
MRMKFPQFKVSVHQVKEGCYMNYTMGQDFIFDDFCHGPAGFCLGAAHSMFPVMYAFTFGAQFPFAENPNVMYTTCPDSGKLVFRIEKLPVEEGIYEGPEAS